MKISNFMKIRPMGVELFPVDGRAYCTNGKTDMTNLIVAFFFNFANALRKNRHAFTPRMKITVKARYLYPIRVQEFSRQLRKKVHHFYYFDFNILDLRCNFQ